METNALAAQALLTLRALLRNSHPEQTLSDMQRGEKLALLLLEEAGGRMLPGELTQAMATSTARTAALLKSLEAKGLVVRQQDTADRRRMPACLTPQGAAELHRHLSVLLQQTQAVFAALGEADSRELVRLLERLREICAPLANPALL